jgi:cytidylate kinase
LRNHVSLSSNKQVCEALKNINLEFCYNQATGENDIYLNEENVAIPIREMLVSETVSEVATLKAVRQFAVAQQQKMGEQKGIVMDGRDIGTTVFPNAELKIFMTADPAVRVERRFKELYAKNPNITLEEVRHNLEMRDYIDSNRDISPLRKAPDAIVLDNTYLTIEQQLKLAIGWVKEKQQQLQAI